MEKQNKQELKEEKKLILKELMEKVKVNPDIRKRFDIEFEDIGDEVDDSVQEVEQMEVDTTIATLLLDRLEKINEQLEQKE